MAAEKTPQDITIRGRLSYPTFTYAEALKRNPKSKFPKPDDKVKPSVNLLLEQGQTDKLLDHIVKVFLPWCVEQEKAGGKSALPEAQTKKIIRAIEEGDFENDPVIGLVNAVSDKTQELAPEAVVSVKVNGFAKQDLTLKALVKSEADLANPMSDLVIPDRGTILPIRETSLELYPGSVCGAQINLFGFISGKNPGITASTSTIVFLEHADRFGGGGSLDEDEFFMDLDD